MLVIPAALLLRSYLPLHHRPYPVTRNRNLQSRLLRSVSQKNELRVCAARSRRRSPVGRTRWGWVLVGWSGTVGPVGG